MKNEPGKKTRLKNLVVNEVSFVDKAANGKRFIITKRDTPVTVENQNDKTTAVEPEKVEKALAEKEKAEAVQKAVADAVAKAKADADVALATALAAKDAEKTEAVNKALIEKVAAEKRLADETEAREVAEAVQKAAASFKNVPFKPEELGPDLRRIRKSDSALADRFEAILKAFDAMALAALNPAGTATAENTSDSAWATIEKRANQLVADKKAASFAEGVEKVLDADKQLYQAYQAEKNQKG